MCGRGVANTGHRSRQQQTLGQSETESIDRCVRRSTVFSRDGEEERRDGRQGKRYRQDRAVVSSAVLLAVVVVCGGGDYLSIPFLPSPHPSTTRPLTTSTAQQTPEDLGQRVSREEATLHPAQLALRPA
jgi:hypothetical protein